MGTISDKLMRIINTKEDIRQALISKGYDVPTSIPFKEYAKMISDLPCRVDSFPDIEGIVARYSALGLTNEQMKENPVWVDKTGNGHDLQMKNFIWGGMSGIGGYNQNFNQWGYGNLPPALQTHTPHKVELNIPSTLKTGNIYSNLGKEGDIYDFTLKIVGLKDGASLRITKGVVSGNIERIEKDGIYKIYQPLETSWDQLRIYIVILNPNLVDLNITIEQLPIYPGALVFDGVDDYGVCDNFPILTKEKGYTVVALRSYLAESIGYLVYNGTSAKQSAFAFERSDSLDTWSWGKNSSIRNLLPKLMSYQTSNSYNNNIISTGTAIEGDKLIRIASVGGYSNVAIWELVFLDHDATEEELTKIKDYFVKTYPWLFPDQAWTVTGKTNEDEDRATIANITGNGNDLVLSNFGFAEGSGYNEEGEYAGYLVTDGVDDKIDSSIFKLGKDFTVVGEWEFLQDINNNSGLRKTSSFIIKNNASGLSLFINRTSQATTVFNVKSLKAFCSNGLLVKNDWTEQIDTVSQIITSSNSKLSIACRDDGVTEYDKFAFKNLAIYPMVLSKDDCIKAYNYLQTLKAK